MNMNRIVIAPVLLVVIVLSAAPPRAARAGPGTVWRVPADDFVNYRIQVVERSDTWDDRFRSSGRIDDVAGFHGYELTDKRRVARAVAYEPMLYVPFVFRLPSSLSVGATTKIDELLPATYRIAALRARGNIRVAVSRKDEAGRFVDIAGDVTLTPASEKPAELALSYRVVTAGHLRWRSTFDTTRGLMTRVTYHLTSTSRSATDERPAGVSSVNPADRTLDALIRLSLDRVYEFRYDGFEADVDRAIETGCTYLARTVRRGDRWRPGASMGIRALNLLALIDGGHGHGKPDVEQGMKWLVEQEPRKTYDVGISMMALEAYRTPTHEAVLRRRGQLRDFLPRSLTEKERAWMTKCADFLLESAITGKNRGAATTGHDDVMRWGYPRDGAQQDEMRRRVWNNSNSQYAVLGLNAAARCGIPIPASVWVKIANHWLNVQARKGPQHKRFILAPHTPRKKGDHRATGTVSSVTAEERGWHYRDALVRRRPGPPRTIPFGSMTCAGISSQAIALGNLRRMKSAALGGGRRHELEASIRNGLASLDAMFSVWENPNYDGWYTYYLYGLERAGMLAGYERFGRHDWYWEGAMQLILRLRRFKTHWSYDLGPDGTTAWAILFLKRSTLPVTITPR
jgi:hypothetical protein